MTSAPEPAPRRTVHAVAAPGGRPVAIRGPLVLTRDPGGVADELARVLGDRGVEARVIEPDWASLDAVAGAIPDQAAGVVHLAALGATGEALAARVRGAFLLAKALGGRATNPLFATVSGQGGRFGTGGEALEGALAGLPKTLAQEWPDARCLAVDVDPDDLDVGALATELLTDRGVVEIGLSDGPITLTVVERPLPSDAQRTPPVSPGELVVVSGGARGVTAAVVLEMARRWRPAFLLLGRSPLADEPAWAAGVDDAGLKAAAVADLRARGDKPSPKAVDAAVRKVLGAREVRGTLEAIRAAGATAMYRAVDVRDAAEVAGVVGEAAEVHGPVRGLVHGAGVLADKLAVDKSPEQFDLVFGTKVGGMHALLDAVDSAALSFVGLFSSVAGRYGNQGQCDYAMANELLARTARDLATHAHAVVKCFDWGPWEAGMVTPALRKRFEAQGMYLIPLAAGAAAFCDELEVADGAVEVVVGGPEHGGALVEKREGSEVVRFSEADAFLSDHRIEGRPVLPAVVVLEWMARAARRAFPALSFAGVRDFAVLKGVVVQGDAELTLRWTAEASPAGRALQMELVGAPGRLGPTVHYRAVVDMAAARPEGGAFPGSNGLSRADYPYPVDEAYRRFLFHGPGLRGIREIVGMSDEGIVGRLNTSEPRALGVSGTSWETDPVALDSALQLMVLWVREKTGASALPCALGEYRQFAPLTGTITCHMTLSPSRTARGAFGATLVDESGRVVATLDRAEYTANPALNEAFRSAGA